MIWDISEEPLTSWRAIFPPPPALLAARLTSGEPDLAEERNLFRQPHGQDPLSKRLPLELGLGMIGQGGPLLTAGACCFSALLLTSASARTTRVAAPALGTPPALFGVGYAHGLCGAERGRGLAKLCRHCRRGHLPWGLRSRRDFLVAFALPTAQEN